MTVSPWGWDYLQWLIHRRAHDYWLTPGLSESERERGQGERRERGSGGGKEGWGERERESETDRGGERQREREREIHIQIDRQWPTDMGLLRGKTGEGKGGQLETDRWREIERRKERVGGRQAGRQNIPFFISTFVFTTFLATHCNILD